MKALTLTVVPEITLEDLCRDFIRFGGSWYVHVIYHGWQKPHVLTNFYSSSVSFRKKNVMFWYSILFVTLSWLSSTEIKNRLSLVDSWCINYYERYRWNLLLRGFQFDWPHCKNPKSRNKCNKRITLVESWTVLRDNLLYFPKCYCQR